VVLWALTAWPRPDAYAVDADVAAGRVTLDAAGLEAARAAEDLRVSLAGRIGRALEPVLAPLGFDWKIATALVGAFAAKEVFVAQMGIVTSLGEVDETSEGLRDALRRDYSPLVGVSLMLFLLIATPCMATLAVTRRESGSWKWAFLQLGGLTGLAYAVSTLVYQVGRLMV
jgi:ferrous iron transport protein B